MFQAGDRILCRKNQNRLGVLNGDLATVVSVDPDGGTLTVQLDRDPETRSLPVWYLDQGQVDYGYALTGHKAQGVTTDHAAPALTDHIDPLGPPPPSSDVAARVAWQIAKRQTERDEIERQTPGLDLAAGR